MASTYPLEVVEADRWASANKNLKGDALRAAADKQDWDDSIKLLVATPSVLCPVPRHGVGPARPTLPVFAKRISPPPAAGP